MGSLISLDAAVVPESHGFNPTDSLRMKFIILGVGVLFLYVQLSDS